MKNITLTIPAPIARYGEEVEAFNRKKKHGDIWEPATITRAEFKMSAFADQELEGKWCYTVILKRKNPRGDSICLYCGEEEVRRIAQ